MTAQKSPLIVVDTKNSRAKLYSSAREAFRVTGIPRTTGQRNVDNGRVLVNRYQLYSVAR
jgi:hypothetical protein